MAAKHHGIYRDESTNSGWFHFGFLRLLHFLVGAFRMPKWPSGEKSYVWTDKWLDRKFDQATNKFQDTFWKFDRAAGYFGDNVETIKRHHDSRDMETFAKHLSALSDTPLYLDMMLLYLRIQADCLANVIPNFYGQQAKSQSISRDSFRNHFKWFTQKRADFDPEYSTILLANHRWFELLAGESHGQGLRDIVVHQRGTYQLGWTMPDATNDFRFRASIVGDSGFVCDDLVPTLQEIVSGYYSFLDQIFLYFSNQIRITLQDNSILAGNTVTQYYRFEGLSPSSFWIYPEIQSLGH
jgi:hypothetical protein